MANKCNNCGKCCAGILLLSSQEKQKIMHYIQQNQIQIVNRQSILQEYIDVCPFLSKDNKCNIYKVRPEICKRFQCFQEPEYDLDYRKLEVVNMYTTFFPQSYCPKVDLNPLKEQLLKNKKKLYGGKSK